MTKRALPDKKLRQEGERWISRIKAAERLEKDWLDDAAKAVRAYTNEEKAENDEKTLGSRYDFNILFANVETIVPAVINSPPVPDIRRRFNDPDPAARIVADLMERAISVQIDDSRLQIELEAGAQDSFLAGRGLVRMKFKSDIVGGEPDHRDIADAADTAVDGADNGRQPEEIGAAIFDEEADALPGSAGIGGNNGDGNVGNNPGLAPERVENERICFEAVSWKDYRHGPAKRWEDRQWDAFRFVIPKEDEAESFDAGLIGSQFDDSEKNDWSKNEDDICGWEVWCRKTRKVKFIGDNGIILKEIDDPLGLKDFFPIPTPMQPIELTGRLKPVNPFSIYRKLADQLDTITKRIDVLTKAMKVKGWYSGEAGDLKSLLALEDNEFVPIDNAELWAKSQGGIAAAIAFWPVEKFIAVLRELYVDRDQTKQAIYEITGISDIARGATAASETATAQSIKSQWGSLRIQKMQRMMERCARDLFVMMSQVIPRLFSLQTLEEMTGIALLPAPNDTPEQQQAKQAVIALLRRPLSAYYRIDVESDSTIRADLTRQKQEVSQFLQGASAYFAAVAPLVQQGALPADAAVEIFAATSRMFNLGKSVEDTLEKMVTDARAKAEQPPAPPGQPGRPEPQQPTPAEVEAAIRTQAAQQEEQRRNAEFQARMQREAAKAGVEGQKAERELAIKLLEEELKRLEIQEKQLAVRMKQIELTAKAGGIVQPPIQEMAP